MGSKQENSLEVLWEVPLRVLCDMGGGGVPRGLLPRVVRGMLASPGSGPEGALPVDAPQEEHHREPSLECHSLKTLAFLNEGLRAPKSQSLAI